MESPHSVNSPRRTLSLSKQRRKTVSVFDPDDKTSGFGLSGDHGPKPSEVYGFVGSITTVVATGLLPFYFALQNCNPFLCILSYTWLSMRNIVCDDCNF